MKKNIIITIALFCFLALNISKAQTTVMNFSKNDCNGTPRDLFADLDAGNAVILEFFMTSCSSCITAGQKLESMKANLISQYPGKIKAYAIGFNNTYDCTTILNWVNTNSFSSIPMDSGATQVAYYGGMGMPTIVIAGGSSHSILGAPYVGFSTSDTTLMANNIRTYLNTQVGIKENNISKISFDLFPNPAGNQITLKFPLNEKSDVVIDVLDIMGRKISTLLTDKLQSGTIYKSFNTTSIPNGNYFIRININGIITQQKLTIVH